MSFVFSDVHLQDTAHLFEPPTVLFTVDAFLQKTEAETFLVDAILIVNHEFSVNAIVKAFNQNNDFTVDALLQTPASIMWANDALLEQAGTSVIAVDALLQLTQTNDFTVDAQLKATQTNDFTVDATLNVVHEFRVDVFLRKVQTLDFIVDGNVEQAKTFDFTVNAVLRFVTDHTFTVDGSVILKFVLEPFTVDAFLRATQTNVFSVDALAFIMPVRAFCVDTLLQATKTNDFTVDAFPQATQVNTFTADAVIVGVTGEIDVQLVTFQTPVQPAVFFTCDVITISARNQNFSLDAILTQFVDSDFTVDALIQALDQELDFRVDGFVAKFARLVHTSIIRENLKTTSVIRRRSA